jgi:hypothetical protein
MSWDLGLPFKISIRGRDSGSGSGWLSHEYLKVVDWTGRWTWRVRQICIKLSLTRHTGIGLMNQRLLSSAKKP